MSFEPRVHGGDAGGVIDFSVSTNPYGPHPAVLAAVREAAVDRYPDPLATDARVALARLAGVDPAGIVVGNGAADLLWTLARALVEPGTRVAIAEPTFCEFRAAVRAPIVECSHDLAQLARQGADVLYLCNPNNPTGGCIALAQVAALAADLPRTTLILDESFLSLSERAAEGMTPMPPNVVRVRSLTKDHTLPGLRVGYVIATPELCARIESARAAWSASAPAQAAAVAACVHTDFVAASRRRLLADRDRLVTALRTRGFDPLPAPTHFFLVPVGDAAATRARLLTHGVAVRDCTSFGLPGHIRIAARPEADCAKLLEAL